jgi:glucosamine 6-phosphate synthetase-like amidotransferase/phosphosugar isomerase protein
LAKKKPKGKKGILSVEIDEKLLKRKAGREKEKLSKEFDKFTGELTEQLEDNEDIQKLKHEIKQRPLVYVTLAFTMGLALGALMRKK